MIYAAGGGDLEKIQWLWQNATRHDLNWLSDMKEFESFATAKAIKDWQDSHGR